MQLYYALTTILLPAYMGKRIKKYLNCLAVIQNKSIKIIRNLKFLTFTLSLYSNTFLSLHQKIQYETILSIYKMNAGILKCNIELPSNISVTKYATRQQNFLRVPNYKTTTSQKSFFTQE